MTISSSAMAAVSYDTLTASDIGQDEIALMCQSSTITVPPGTYVLNGTALPAIGEPR